MSVIDQAARRGRRGGPCRKKAKRPVARGIAPRATDLFVQARIAAIGNRDNHLQRYLSKHRASQIAQFGRQNAGFAATGACRWCTAAPKTGARPLAANLCTGTADPAHS
ncbi:hypothetical protein [Vogesella indigofera]|uniref:hypothetical protein n=1 Tax=Vogesella indigofera TaxID=45465 RepID=UPI00234E5839|nr:hypothetical protein [Vogesella indigofera]MDC7706712.1 hypothetical protein [Vogesella indigofera]